jgi:hypothetical protein
MAAIIAVGVLGLLAVVGNGLAETRIVTVRAATQTTVARESTPLPARATVDHPKHRRP